MSNRMTQARIERIRSVLLAIEGEEPEISTEQLIDRTCDTAAAEREEVLRIMEMGMDEALDERP